MRTLFIAALLLLPLSSGLGAEAPFISSSALKAAEGGISRIYEMDFDAADQEFRKIQAENPEHPFGYYGPAGASWVRFVYGSQRSDMALEADFERKVEASVQKAQAWLKLHPRDPYGLLALGGSYGLRTRFAVSQGHWMRAVLDGRRALKATREAQKADPGLQDVYLGIGMWEYYADVFPRMVKSLGRLLLGGDRARGLAHIQMAAEKGRFVNIAAKLILIEIYIEDQFGLRNPRQALSMIRDLRQQFPNSPIFQQIEQISLYESGDYDGAWAITEDYVNRIQSGQPFYAAEDMARMHLVYGTIHFVRRKLQEAAKEFEESASMAGEKSKPNRWALWGMLRWGEVEDALGHKDEAKAHYRGVFGYPDLFGYYAYAKHRLSHPYIAGSSVGIVSPP